MKPPLLQKIARSLARDRDLPVGARIAKGRRYIAASALAPHRLRACDRVGARPRVLGRPVVRNEGSITIGDDLVINAGPAPCELAAGPGATLRIGNKLLLNFGSLLVATSSVTIGDGVNIGPYCVVSDAERPDDAAEPIVVGDGVWLAGRVTLRPGARIGAGSTIAAGSVVEGEIPPGVLAGGVPARVLRPIRAPGGAPPAARHSRADAPAGSTPRGVVVSDFATRELVARLADSTDAPAMVAVAAPLDLRAPLLPALPDAQHADFAVVWTRPDQVSPAFARALDGAPVTDEEILADVDAFCDAIEAGATRFRVVIAPTWSLAAGDRGLGMRDARPGGNAWMTTRMNARLMERAAEMPNVFVLDATRWRAAAGIDDRAARAWYLGAVALPPNAVAAAACDIKATVRGALGHARTLLVLGLDHTWWNHGRPDAARDAQHAGAHATERAALADFQRAVRRLARRGVVLALASSDAESVVFDMLRQQPDVLLRDTDFAARRMGGDKVRHVADLASELGIALQHVVFVDADPAERARVRDALPDVLVPDWPADRLRYPQALAALHCFDAPDAAAETEPTDTVDESPILEIVR